MECMCCVVMPDVNFSELSGVNRIIVPFLACGDLSAYDSDMTYPLEVSVLSEFLHGYLDMLVILMCCFCCVAWWSNG